jgi:hypothetical protein
MEQGLAEDVMVAQLVRVLESVWLKLSEGCNILNHPGWSLHHCYVEGGKGQEAAQLPDMLLPANPKPSNLGRLGKGSYSLAYLQGVVK